MNPEDMFQRYLNKYQITYQHPEHGLVMLTSPIWPKHPELQQSIQRTFQGLDGVTSITINSPEQLVMRYQSDKLRRLSPLTLLSLERQLSKQYHQAGY